METNDGPGDDNDLAAMEAHVNNNTLQSNPSSYFKILQVMDGEPEGEPIVEADDLYWTCSINVHCWSFSKEKTFFICQETDHEAEPGHVEAHPLVVTARHALA